MNITDTINAQVKSLVDDVKGLPKSLKKVDVADLRSQAQGLAKTAVGQATGAYAGLTKQGEKLVSKAKGIKHDGVKDAQKTANEVKDKAEKFVDEVKDKAEELVDDVKATVTKVAKNAPAAKPAATKPATKTAARPAAKKPAAKSAPKPDTKKA